MSHDIVQKRQIQPVVAQQSFLRRHGQKVIALLFWLALLGSYQWYAWRNEMSALETLAQIVNLLRSTTLGPLLFIMIYAVRPLVLFPATVLTLGAGVVFGPVLGIVYTIIGSNLSAMVAYFIGRFFGDGLVSSQRHAALFDSYTKRLRSNSFETVLIMRFMFLPYDLVNYLCGVLRINWRAYLLATVLGSLPGTFAFVLAGASLKGDFTQGLPSFDWRVFAVSVVLLVASLAIARYVKSNEQHTKAA